MDLATFQGIGQGINQGVAHGLNVGMRLREQESLDRHRHVLEEQTKAQTAVNNLHLDELRQKQEDYDRITDIKTTPGFLSLPEEQQKQVLGFMATNKYTDENGIGKKGEQAKGWATIASTQELFDTVLMKPKLKELSGKALEAWNALQEAKATGDPKKIQTATALYNQANTALQSATDGGYKHLTMLQQHDLKLKEQESKKKNVIVSGGSSFDADTGQPIYLKPEKGSGTESQSDKSTDKALKRIDDFIKGYDSQITIFEKRLEAAEKAEDEEEITKWTNAINDHQEQKSKAINTKNQVLNGTLAPDAIVWGGNKSTTYKTADDVKAAFKSGKIKEAEAVKILKDKFGMK
jgi:hypothetical protein